MFIYVNIYKYNIEYLRSILDYKGYVYNLCIINTQ